jgi:hypothetical protein
MVLFYDASFTLAVACQLLHKLHQPSVLLPAQSIDFTVSVLRQI